MPAFLRRKLLLLLIKSLITTTQLHATKAFNFSVLSENNLETEGPEMPLDQVVQGANDPQEVTLNSTESDISQHQAQDEVQAPAQPEENNFEILGAMPKHTSGTSEPLHTELATRWTAYLQNGLPKEQKHEICEKYPFFENCSLLNPPSLGPELTSCLDAKTLRQDKFMSLLQKETGHALASLGSQITKLLKQPIQKEQRDLIATLADSAQLMCNVHHALSTHRKFSIAPFLKPASRKLLSSSLSDEFLLGKTFFQELKANQTAVQTGREIKATYMPPPSKHLQSNNSPRFTLPSKSNNLNFKRPAYHNKKRTMVHQPKNLLGQQSKKNYQHAKPHNY